MDSKGTRRSTPAPPTCGRRRAPTRTPATTTFRCRRRTNHWYGGHRLGKLFSQKARVQLARVRSTNTPKPHSVNGLWPAARRPLHRRGRAFGRSLNGLWIVMAAHPRIRCVLDPRSGRRPQDRSLWCHPRTTARTNLLSLPPAAPTRRDRARDSHADAARAPPGGPGRPAAQRRRAWCHRPTGDATAPRRLRLASW